MENGKWKVESEYGSQYQEKSYRFAIRIVKLCKILRTTRKEYVLSDQLLRSETSIGANTAEAQNAKSCAEFHSIMRDSVEIEKNYRLA
ncbi:MAG: four helix bundle protein [Faecousia sp.]